MLPKNVTRSATDTKITKITRRDAGTDEPMMSASSTDDGMPSRELRIRARFTWSPQARRVFSLSGLLVTRAISARSSPP